jgi:hypothetical protein
MATTPLVLWAILWIATTTPRLSFRKILRLT